MSSALTFIALQAGWFTSVLGAAAGRPLLGVIFVALSAAVHLARSEDRRGLAFALGAAAVLGLVADGSLALAGILVFPPQAALGWPVPIWMLALWVNFALAIDSLAWFAPRPWLAALAGAVGGPLSYLAGARLGAVTLVPTEPVALAVIGLVWLFAMPLLLCVLPAFAARAASAGQARSAARAASAGQARSAARAASAGQARSAARAASAGQARSAARVASVERPAYGSERRSRLAAPRQARGGALQPSPARSSKDSL